MARNGRTSQGQNSVWRYQAINQETGEVVDLVRGTPRGGWGQHARLFLQTMGRLGREGRIGKEGWRVLACLLGRLDWDNWLVVPQRELAAALEMSQQNISRAIRQLREEGVLRQAAPPAPRSTYRLSAEFAYRGQYNGWQKRRREEQHERETAPQEDGSACPYCGSEPLYQDGDGRWGCVACNRWLEKEPL